MFFLVKLGGGHQSTVQSSFHVSAFACVLDVVWSTGEIFYSLTHKPLTLIWISIFCNVRMSVNHKKRNPKPLRKLLWKLYHCCCISWQTCFSDHTLPFLHPPSQCHLVCSFDCTFNRGERGWGRGEEGGREGWQPGIWVRCLDMSIPPRLVNN